MSGRPSMFMIVDELHAEPHGTYPSFNAALAELRRLAMLPWDELPNQAPCTNWRGCGRNYDVAEYDISTTPWREKRRDAVLRMDAAGPRWAEPWKEEHFSDD